MNRIVRRAQKNFQFATIYEQRKTNQLLVSGFGNLSEALNNIGYCIEESMNNLSDTISVSLEKQNYILRDIIDHSQKQVQEIKGAIESEGKERQKHEEKEREMLDNIQRRRKLI